MTRLLLTLLALLTGLAAQLSPAQAAVRRSGETEIGAIEQTPKLAVAARTAERRIAETPSDLLAVGPSRALPRTYATVPVRTVLTRIDRARE